jgi:hypothetical protein
LVDVDFLNVRNLVIFFLKISVGDRSESRDIERASWGGGMWD